MKKINKIMCSVFLLGLSHCGLAPLKSEPVDLKSFYVVSMSPQNLVSVSEVQRLEVAFSQSVLPETLKAENIFLLRKEDFEPYTHKEADDLIEAYIAQEFIPIPADLRVQTENARVVQMQFSQNLAADQSYVLVVLPEVKSELYFSLDQRYLGVDQRYFASEFRVVSNKATEAEVSSWESDNSVSEPLSNPSLPGTNYPTTAIPATSPNTNSTTDRVELFDWNRILITEIVTDPQQDHGESEIGNGIVFDSIAGVGSATSADEYIEIFNGTESSVDLSGWSLNMNDGTDVSQALNDESWQTYFSAGGSLDNLAAGEFVVLGDPDGLMNNDITVQLLNEMGEIMDDVIVNDANATDESDEAYFLDAEGTWLQGIASPGGF